MELSSFCAVTSIVMLLYDITEVWNIFSLDE